MTLYDAVKRQLGIKGDELKETLQDVASHGADAGFHGFIYYTETAKFYDKYEDLIWEALETDTEDMGEKTPLAFIASFTGAKNVTNPATFKNLLAWYALERVAREQEE